MRHPGQFPRGVMFPPMDTYYYPQTIDADGVNDHWSLSSDITGMADGKAGTFICYLHPSTVGDDRILTSGGAAFSARLFGSRFIVSAKNTSGTEILKLKTNTNLTAVPLLLAASWDLATAAGHIFINGVDDERGVDTKLTDGTIDYTKASWAQLATVAGTAHVDGNVAFIWFDPSYHDFTSAVVLDDMWDEGRVQDPGTDGSNYFGGQPLFFSDRRGDISDWATDKGTAGDTWTEVGAFADGGKLIP